jgi:hypothetical protein
VYYKIETRFLPDDLRVRSAHTIELQGNLPHIRDVGRVLYPHQMPLEALEHVHTLIFDGIKYNPADGDNHSCALYPWIAERSRAGVPLRLLDSTRCPYGLDA